MNIDKEKNDRLLQLIHPVQSPTYEVDYAWPYFFKLFLQETANDYGGLELNPDFQRGHVWTVAQQTHFIENVMRKIVPLSGLFVQFNCPNWNWSGVQTGELPIGFQCIDGLQRITAVSEFIAGNIHPFGLGPADLQDTFFTAQAYKFRVAVYTFQTRRELLRHYLDFNAGGTPHADEEIARVKKLYDETQ